MKTTGSASRSACRVPLRGLAGLWLTFATATAILLAVENAGAQSQPPDTSGPAYQADSDGDGVVDALDTCPSENVAMAGRSADPACYLGDATRPAMTWLADEYKRTGSASEGTFWTLAGCQPDRAFPVEDTTSDARQFRGVVITGIGEQTGCLISIDYGNVPVVAIPRAPSLVELYATWNPELGAGGSYLPSDGLGLIRNGGVEFINTRIPERSIVQRLKFTRGALYGVNLLVVNRICVGQTCAITLNPEPDWSILPTGLDDALMSQRTAIRTALNLPQPKDFPDSIDDAIEGVPRGWRVDDRYPFATPAARARGLESPPPSIVLSNRARLFAPLNYAGQDDVADSWLVVPEVIGNLGLEFLARPKGPPQYSPQRSAQDKLLVFQTFALPNSYDGISVARNVEAIWPKANAADAIVASTSEASAAYGDRWTTNAGPTDCWDSEDDPNPVRYQFGSAGPDAKIADAWCPSAQRAWWASRPETNAQGGADRTCEAFQKSVADYKNAFLAAGNIVESVYCSNSTRTGRR